MNALLKIKVTLAEATTQRSAWYRYAGLALILVLFLIPVPPSSGYHPSGLIIPLMALLAHLAFAFRWSQPVTIALRVGTLAWVVMGGFLLR